MGSGNRLLLNVTALEALPEEKKVGYVLTWLRFLDAILPETTEEILKSVQAELVQQLESQISNSDPASWLLLARCLLQVHSVGDFEMLHGTVDLCNNMLKANSTKYTKMAAIASLSALYECMGFLLVEKYKETFSRLTKWLKIAESQSRAEILNTLRSMIIGLGTAANNIHKEMYKQARSYASDRVPSVRIAAIRCLAALVPVFPYMYINDWDQLFTSCVKALEGSTCEVRTECAQIIANIIATALDPPKLSGPKQPGSEHDCPMNLEKAIEYLSNASKKKYGSRQTTNEIRDGLSMVVAKLSAGCAVKQLDSLVDSHSQTEDYTRP